MASTLTPSRPQSVAAPREPFFILRKEMDDLLSNFLGAPTTNWLSNSLSPATDIAETENTFIVKLDIPGIQATDFNVQVHGNTLTLPKAENAKPKKIVVKS
ncbi:MAG: Hsp20/alpha crystallin family protein [Pirellulaceae bacterium]|nr:Hsp20/alpha crystallin family protein [Pirellulaceae bacterium]